MPKEVIQSSYAKQQSRINSILRKISEYESIHKFELMESMRITISEYNKLKPLLEFNGLKHGVELSGNHWISNKKEINPIKTELKDIEIE